MQTIKVQVAAGTMHEYPSNIAGYGDFRARGGHTVTLAEAYRKSGDILRTNRDTGLRSVTMWVVLDDSGLVYQAEFTENRHQILTASPLPGVDLQDVYVT